MLLQQVVTWIVALVLSMTPSPPVTPAETVEAAVMRVAYEQLGKRYVWAGKGPDVFDCSGLTAYVWREAAGIEFRAYTVAQWKSLPKVELADMQPGDLLFSRDLSHVYIFVGNGTVVHAPGTGQTITEAPVPAATRIRSQAVRPSLLDSE